MAKKLVLFFFLFLASKLSHADMSFTLGFRSGYTSSESFNLFRTSYSTYLKDQLEEEVSPFGLGYGLGVGLDYADGLYIFAHANYYLADTKAKFKLGGEQRFNYAQSLFDLGLGYGVTDDVSYGIGIGMSAGSDRINSYHVFADGTRSMVPAANRLNGSYSRTRLTGILTGFWSIEIRNDTQFYTKLDFLFGSLFGYNPLYDLFEARSNGLAESTDGLPTDYKAYVEEFGLFTYSNDDFVKTDFNGLRLEIGLRFLL